MKEALSNVEAMDGYVTLDDGMTADIEDLHRQLTDAQLHPDGREY